MSLKRDQLELLSGLDAILASIERQKDVSLADVFNNLSISANPFDFLLAILQKQVTIDDLIEWLSSVLTVAIPGIETAIKGVLLTNLKSTISCGIDPSIPLWIRTDGFHFNPHAIDYRGVFRFDPMSRLGQYYYFGASKYYTVVNDDTDEKYYLYQDAYEKALQILTDKHGGDITQITESIEDQIVLKGDISNYYQLARAKDFDAFLWFVQNKCLVNNPIQYNDEFNKVNHPLGTIARFNDNIYDICVTEDETFIPFAYSTPTSANWYVNSGTYYNYLKPNNKKERDFSKEKPICNIQNNGDVNTSLTLRVLPQPLIHYPKIGDKKVTITKILFSRNPDTLELTPDKNGTISIDADYYIKNDNDEYSYYKGDEKVLDYNSNNGKYVLTTDNINYFYECYSGLTVYELNYDLIMSMQLFDAKVLASQIIQAVFGSMRIGVNINVTTTPMQSEEEILFHERIMDIVDKIVVQDTDEISDCFFSFSNEKYNEMLKNSENKYYNNIPFNFDEEINANINLNDIYDILNGIDDSATLNENKEIITKALTQLVNKVGDAATNSSPNQSPTVANSRYSIGVNIIINLIKSLTNAIMSSILSPKIVLLFELNKRLLMSETKVLTFDEFLKSIINIVSSIILEIRDYLLQMLLDWVLKIVMEIAGKLGIMLIKEQLDFYIELLRRLITECAFTINFLTGDNIDKLKMDMSTYANIIRAADIDRNAVDANNKLIKEC